MIYVLLILAGISLLFTGFKNTLKALPIIIIVGLLIFFLGTVVVSFLPVIIIFIVLRTIFGKKRTQGRTRTYYYNGNKGSSNRANTQDFEEFFKQATGGSYGNSQYQQRQNNNMGNFGYSVNKDQYYNELGISKSSTQEEIKKAYRSMAMKYHPDKANNLDDKTKEQYEAKFKKINEAYENLK